MNRQVDKKPLVELVSRTIHQQCVLAHGLIVWNPNQKRAELKQYQLVELYQDHVYRPKVRGYHVCGWLVELCRAVIAITSTAGSRVVVALVGDW